MHKHEYSLYGRCIAIRTILMAHGYDKTSSCGRKKDKLCIIRISLHSITDKPCSTDGEIF